MSSSVLFKIDKIIRETKDTLSFVLIPLQNERLKYKAGQFLTFLFHFPQGTVRRSYSLSSSPSVDLWPIVTIKVVPNGEISRFIHQYWKVGDTVEALPPAGMFILEKSETPKDLFLLAAGSGITPIFSLINELLSTPVAHKLHLYYSNLNKEETIFYEQLESLRLKHKERFDVTYFFSESKFLDKARLSKYLLIDLVESSLVYSKEDAVFFVCGPFEYMQMVGIALHSASIQSNQIRKEIFVTNDVELPKFEMADKRTK
ncbi:MAG: ferredoxin, partial [Cytophagales bacterium]|nr:ferredoxin [Cytophagales bacterium]